MCNVHAAFQWGRTYDAEYLARAIFQEMVGQEKRETGFGIGIGLHGDLNWPLVTVDTVNNVVELEGKNSWTFEEFKKLSDIEAVAAQVLEVE